MHLPFDDFKNDFLDLVRRNQVVILAAKTGAGKSTKAALALLNAGFAGLRIIGVTEPRRPAAVLLSQWVADLHGTPMGQVVGYQIGKDRQYAQGVKLKYMTEGILLTEMRSDPLLKRYNVIVLDEVHERGVFQDLIMALVLQVLPKRPDLKVVVMSATIDEEKFANYFQAPVIKIPGRVFPIEIRYDRTDPPDLDAMIDRCAEKALEILREDDNGDILVFLPDPQTISMVDEKLTEALKGKLADIRILPLFSAQAPEDQKRALERGNERRVILATNIAETSLTIDGVRHVIDSGYIKATVYVDAWMSALKITDHSKAGCDQRAGRAGRTTSGICHRLFTKQNYDEREAFTTPEINRMALDQTLLSLRCFGFSTQGIIELPFLSPPEQTRWVQAQERLQVLGAISADGALTDDGWRMNTFNLDPVISRMLITAEKYKCVYEVAKVAGSLSLMRPIFTRPQSKEIEADAAHMEFKHALSDPLGYVTAWTAWNECEGDRTWAREHFLSSRALEEMDRQILGILETLERAGVEITNSDSEETVRKAVSAGLIVNLAVLSGEYNYACADRVTWIHPGSNLFSAGSKMLVCTKIVQSGASGKNFMRDCHKVEPEWIEEIIPPHLLEREWSFTRTTESGHVAHLLMSYRGMVVGSMEKKTFDADAIPFLAQTLLKEVFASIVTSGRFIHPDNRSNREFLRGIQTRLTLLSGDFLETLNSIKDRVQKIFEDRLQTVRSVDELLAANLILTIKDILPEDQLAQFREWEAEESARVAERDRRVLEEKNKREIELAPIKIAVRNLDERLNALGVSVRTAMDQIRYGVYHIWEDLFSAYGGCDISTLKKFVSDYRAKVEEIEHENKPRFEMAERIRNDVLALMPRCPLCGRNWNAEFVCDVAHNTRRVLEIASLLKTESIGEFCTNRDERVAHVRLMDMRVTIEFVCPIGKPWMGNVFKSANFKSTAVIFPDSLLDDVDEITDWIRELRAAQEEFEKAKAEAKALQAEQTNGSIAVIVPFCLVKNQPEADFQGERYRVEFADVWPSAGEYWLALLHNSKQLGKSSSVRPIKKMGQYATAEQVEELKKMIRSGYPDLPTELL